MSQGVSWKNKQLVQIRDDAAGMVENLEILAKDFDHFASGNKMAEAA